MAVNKVAVFLAAVLTVLDLCAGKPWEYYNYRRVPCIPGDLVFVDCNLCTCNPQGVPNEVCARMWCPPTPKPPLTQETPDATAVEYLLPDATGAPEADVKDNFI